MRIYTVFDALHSLSSIKEKILGLEVMFDSIAKSIEEVEEELHTLIDEYNKEVNPLTKDE